MEIIDQMNRERVLYFFRLYAFFFVLELFVRSFGGILGWDPVHTTCIPDEMMMTLQDFYERSYKI